MHKRACTNYTRLLTDRQRLRPRALSARVLRHAEWLLVRERLLHERLHKLRAPPHLDAGRQRPRHSARRFLRTADDRAAGGELARGRRERAGAAERGRGDEPQAGAAVGFGGEERRGEVTGAACMGTSTEWLFACLRAGAAVGLGGEHRGTGDVWQTLNVGTSRRVPNNLIICGAVHGHISEHCLGVVCRTSPVLR